MYESTLLMIAKSGQAMAISFIKNVFCVFILDKMIYISYMGMDGKSAIKE